MKNYNFYNIRVVFVHKAESKTDYSRIHFVLLHGFPCTHFGGECNSTLLTFRSPSISISSVVQMCTCFVHTKHILYMLSDVDWLGEMYMHISYEIPGWRKQKQLPHPP